MNNAFSKLFDPLTQDQEEKLRKRMDRYQEQLEEEGYDVHFARAKNGMFATILVQDPDGGKIGFLEKDGSVSWLDGEMKIGKVGSAVQQNPTDQFEEMAGIDEIEKDVPIDLDTSEKSEDSN